MRTSMMTILRSFALMFNPKIFMVLHGAILMNLILLFKFLKQSNLRYNHPNMKTIQPIICKRRVRFPSMLSATEYDLLPDLQSHTQEEVCQWDTWRSLPDVWRTFARLRSRRLTGEHCWQDDVMKSQ